MKILMNSLVSSSRSLPPKLEALREDFRHMYQFLL
jgi:hypothetical protein